MANQTNSKIKTVSETPEQLYARAKNVLARDPFIVKQAFRAENYRKAAALFHLIPEYEDAKEQEALCLTRAEEADQAELAYRYDRAVTLRNEASTAKGYEKAISQFQTVPNFRDSAAQIAACEEKRARFSQRDRRKKAVTLGLLLVFLGAGIWFFHSPVWDRLWLYITTGSSAGTEVTTSDTEETSLLTASEGDVVSFGAYDWYVLTKEEDRVQLLLNHAEKHEELRHRPYHDSDEDITWAESSLRTWLNSEFLEQSFTEAEQAQILSLTTPAIDNASYGTDGGEDSEDMVTLLSPEEVTAHMDLIKGIRMNIWLRSPGNASNTAVFMSARNEIMDYGYLVSTTDFYTCPVIWVRLDTDSE